MHAVHVLVQSFVNSIVTQIERYLEKWCFIDKNTKDLNNLLWSYALTNSN
jgi:hypothetical protein